MRFILSARLVLQASRARLLPSNLLISTHLYDPPPSWLHVGMLMKWYSLIHSIQPQYHLQHPGPRYPQEPSWKLSCPSLKHALGTRVVWSRLCLGCT